MSDIILPPNHLVKFYISLQQKLQEQWGERSIVLLQNGKFYEIYQVFEAGKAEIAAKILCMQISLKNGIAKPHSIDNPYMVGFPVDKLSNHLAKFLRENFVVSVYEQISVDGSQKKGYKHLKIYSPGVYIDDGVARNSYIAAIEYETWICPISGLELSSVYAVFLDLSTGESAYMESLDEPHCKHVESDLHRIVSSYRPVEIILSDDRLVKKIKTNYPEINIIVREIKKEWRRPSYQNELFKTVFNHQDLKTPLESLKLDKNPEIATLIVAIYSYAWNIDKKIVTRLKQPVNSSITNYLILNRDSISQLHIDSLFRSLNKTKTPMGERLLYYKLLNPSLDADELSSIYQQTNYFIKNKIELSFISIGDLEKRIRKMLNNSFKVYHTVELYDSLNCALPILKEYRSLFNIPKNIIREIYTLLKEIETLFDIDALRKREVSFLRDPELTEIEDQINLHKRFFYEVAEKISEKVLVDFTDRDGYYLKTTTARMKKIPKDMCIVIESSGSSSGSANHDSQNDRAHSITLTYDDLYTETLSSSVKIKSKQFLKKNTIIEKLKEKLSTVQNSKFIDILNSFTEKYYDSLVEVSRFIAQIDFVQSSARISREKGYCCPEIVESESSISFFSASKLRHPVIESIIETQYIPNDIELSGDGMLIYGINAVGKSSLLRSVGIAIVMAQAGLFVAAESFRYSIFTRIISKISTKDDMESGKSTFMIELQEIYDMVSVADSKTLVISDELCCSTELESAHALVAATLEQLVEKRSSFIFSTHLKGLQFSVGDRLTVTHMDAYIENGKLVSNRILKPGGIVENYGLELARSWGMQPDLLKRAFVIRDGEGEIISTQSSRYNKDLYMDCCKICGSKDNLHTHHIQEQYRSDDKGLIENRFHKNKKFNLLVVCEECHRKIHA
jgi:DNA mismatch repair protein MutS